MKKKMVWFLVLTMVVTLFLAGCGGSKPEAAKNEPPKVVDINIATATTTGVYYVLGNGLAQMWQNKVPNVRASAQSTEGSVQNMNLLQKGETHVAFSMNQVVGNAYNGLDKFEGRANKELRVITALYPNVVQIVAPAKANIKSVNDFKGKRFVPGAAGSGTETATREVFSVFGLDYKDNKDLKVDYVGFTQAVELMKNGQTDGTLISAGVPNAALMDLTNSADAVLISLEPDKVNEIVQKYPHYFPFTIPANTYKGQTQPVNTIAQANLLVTTSQMDADLVYLLTKAIFENKDDLVAAHSAARDITKEAALSGLMGVPLHPGAAKYFKEIGLQVPAN